MANGRNDKCIIYINQGSASYREKLTKIGEKLSSSAEIIGKIKLTSLAICFVSNFLFSMKNIGFLISFLRNYRLRNVFFDGLRLRNKHLSISYRVFYTIYYFLVANYMSSRLDQSSKNWIIIPDEAYGNALIACLCSRLNCVILTNISDTRGNSLPYCKVLTFSSPVCYKYSDRRLYNLDNISSSNLHFEWVQNFYSSLERQDNKFRSDWIGDLSKGNNLGAIAAASSNVNDKSAVVVCGHILADFPASRNWDYESFEAWLDDLLPKLKNHFPVVYYKPHPGTERYVGEERRLSKLYQREAFHGVDILPLSEAIDLKSYAAIFSANGSVLIEASIEGATAFSSSDGLTCRLPNVTYAPNIDKLDFPSPEYEIEEFDFVKFAPVLFYWYCSEFQNIHDYDDWVYNLIELSKYKAEENMAYLYCDVDDVSTGFIPTYG